MITEAEKYQLLLTTHQNLLDAILHRGKEPENQLKQIMDPSITGTGSAKHELWIGVEEYLDKLFRNEIGRMPDDIEVIYHPPQVIVKGDLGIIFGTSLVKFTISGNVNIINKRRTVVFEWIDNHWKAIHLHASEPSYQITDGESWPMEALKAKNEELTKLVNEKTLELTLSIEKLRSAQAQLIQSEKMASLGELTAGIAHEIQNPLNFINNFSELNIELISELQAALTNLDLEEARFISDSVKENESKINFHGKKADSIVKGMLQHNRSGAGTTEITDFNALVNEYLKLAYHGLRNKNQSLNVNLVTDFDESIDRVEINAQEIGRVVLNLVTNAIHALTDKRIQSDDHFVPKLTIATRKYNGKIGVSVTDNGNGIPSKLLDKIFQPFFTTRPPGKGTGLGLSLSYDIIKSLGGELTVETEEGIGSTFSFQIPVTAF